MKSSDTILATRYAKALFEAAVGAGQEEKVAEELILVRSVAQDPACAATLGSPRLGGVQKKELLNKAFQGRCSDLTNKFLGLLVDKKRWSLLGSAAEAFDKLLAQKRNVARAQVRTARPLGEDARKSIQSSLEAFSGQKIELEIVEDKDLIGGVFVRLGDWAMDASVAGELARLRQKLAGDPKGN